jgi:predicted patatin/cPLA2 family phospholipase
MRLSMLRKFAPDPLLAEVMMTEDQRAHPVVQAIRRRRDEGSQPGARTDGRRIALVIEGGGMRGVVSAGMTAAIEQLHLRDAFDEIHGASAGAFNGAFLISGQAAYLAALYPHGFGDPRFVSLRRALRGYPLFDMDYVIGEVWRTQRPLRVDRILSSPIQLHCTATDVETAAIVDLTDLDSEHEIRCAMRASARLPWLAGSPVEFRQRRLLDATLAEAIPMHVAETSATDVLVLQTRPRGVAHSGLSTGVSRLTDGYLSKINPALVELRRTRSERYDHLSAQLADRAQDPSASPAVCVIRPPAEALLISQVENRRTALTIAGAHGLRAAWMALEGEDPELLSVPRGYARTGSGARTAEPAAAPAASM